LVARTDRPIEKEPLYQTIEADGCPGRLRRAPPSHSTPCRGLVQPDQGRLTYGAVKLAKSHSRMFEIT